MPEAFRRVFCGIFRETLILKSTICDGALKAYKSMGVTYRVIAGIQWMVDYPERKHLAAGQWRPLGEGTDALREAVIVVDVASPTISLTLINAAARRFIFSPDAGAPAADISSPSLPETEAITVIADSGLVPTEGEVALTRHLTCRLPRGKKQILTQVKVLDLDGGTSDRVDGPVDSVSESTGSYLYPITQETLTNAARHADATSVFRRLRCNARKFSLRIIDDGVGSMSR